ncbi:uncharacterized protein LOC116412996 [Galleria mellonella]|uniref:Uncharacterized protein LOC116412996 n=1 Tax=Galleria mellonella TaxID=7137 RepID=A0A6J3BY51_GALME|nr:uncharacterized protein LOC116412996 [Galleria mellonella]
MNYRLVTMFNIKRLVQFAFKNNKKIIIRKYTPNLKLKSDQICNKLMLRNSKDGSIIRLRIEDLSQDIFEEFLDFTMNYFVKEEITHKIAGIIKDPEAMKEYREISTEIFKSPSIITKLYIIDDETNCNGKIVGASMTKLITSVEDTDDDIIAKTEAMKRYVHILTTFNKMYGIADVMRTYNVNCYLEDLGMIVHPEYRSIGIALFEEEARLLICKQLNIPLAGAWCTSRKSQKIGKERHWITAFETPYKKIESLLGISFDGIDIPPTCKYMVYKIE